MTSRVLLTGVFLAVCAALLNGQQCPVKPGAQPFQQEVSGPHDHFEWYSAYGADASVGNGNDFERHVRNLGAGLLKYDWTIGRMYNFGLPPGHLDTLCVNYGRANSARGPLYHGRLNESSDTSVWEGEGESSSGRIISRFTFFFVEKTGDPQVDIVLESTFNGEAYSYSVRNIGRAAVRVGWHAFRVNLVENLKTVDSVSVHVVRAKKTPDPPSSSSFEIGARSESAIAEQIKEGEPFEAGHVLSLNVPSTAPPKVILTNLDVGALDGRPLAGAALPILLRSR
jgi:hypothetical protein